MPRTTPACSRPAGRAAALTLFTLLAIAAPARAQPYLQVESFEITPTIGVRFGGTLNVQPDRLPATTLSLQDGTSYGLAAGVRFDELSLFEVRWTHAKSGLRLDAVPGVAAATLGDVTLNQFHADFTREFPIPEIKGLRSFLTGSVGVSYLSAPGDSFTRFSFGLGGGLKQFVGSHFAIKGEAKWAPIAIAPEVGAWACGTVGYGGCFLVFTGQLLQQYELSVGPVLRF